MANNIRFEDYFPHCATASSDPKLIQLIQKEGMRGYGLYWHIIELLRSQDNYQFPYLESSLKHIARSAHVQLSTLRRVLSNYELFVLKDGVISSPGLSKRMQHLDDKREKLSESGRRAAEAKWQKVKGCADADAVLDKASTVQAKQDNPSETPPLFPPRGKSFNFWKDYTPPSAVFNPKTHNYAGFLRKLNELEITDNKQLLELMQLSCHGQLGNACWRLFAKHPISYFKGLQNPGKSLIRALRHMQSPDSQDSNCQF